MSLSVHRVSAHTFMQERSFRALFIWLRTMARRGNHFYLVALKEDNNIFPVVAVTSIDRSSAQDDVFFEVKFVPIIKTLSNNMSRRLIQTHMIAQMPLLQRWRE